MLETNKDYLNPNDFQTLDLQKDSDLNRVPDNLSLEPNSNLDNKRNSNSTNSKEFESVLNKDLNAQPRMPTKILNPMGIKGNANMEKNFGQVFSRKNLYEKMTKDFLHSRESDPKQNQPSGNPQLSSQESDMPIAIRKGVRSCTRYPMS